MFQNSHFAHNSNSVDNAYGLHLWNANGTIVRNNVLHDSRYWRGGVNSHGITFMVAGDEEGSAIIGAGDPSVYSGASVVDMGMWPPPR